MPYLKRHVVARRLLRGQHAVEPVVLEAAEVPGALRDIGGAGAAVLVQRHGPRASAALVLVSGARHVAGARAVAEHVLDVLASTGAAPALLLRFEEGVGGGGGVPCSY